VSNELRCLISDASHEQIIEAVNRLLTVANGDQGGRIWLFGDDGIRRNIIGGAQIDTANYPLRVRSAAGNHGEFMHSNTVTTVARFQDAGATIPIIAGNTRFANNVDVDGTFNADGATTLGSTVVITGALTANGAVTLGDAAGDAITITGTATFTPLATFTGGLTSTGTGTFNGAVVLGDAAADTVTVNGTATFKVTPIALAPASGTTAAFIGYNHATPGSASVAATMRATSTSMEFRADSPSGSFQPMNFVTNNVTQLVITEAGDIKIGSGTGLNIGFFGSSGNSKQTVTGSRAGNAALASLLTALAAYGFIVNSSSA
jgi:hypothetical protein